MEVCVIDSVRVEITLQLYKLYKIRPAGTQKAIEWYPTVPMLTDRTQPTCLLAEGYWNVSNCSNANRQNSANLPACRRLLECFKLFQS